MARPTAGEARGFRLGAQALCALGLAFLWGLAGCGGGEEHKPEAAPAAAAQAQSPAPAPAPAAPAPAQEAAPAAAAHPPAGQSGEQPAASPGDVDLPSDVPRYPGAEVSEVASNEPNNVSVSFRSADPPEKVVDHYFQELRKNDWVVEQTKSEDGQALFADKGNRSLTVMVHDKPGEGSEISLLLLDIDESVE